MSRDEAARALSCNRRSGGRPAIIMSPLCVHCSDIYQGSISLLKISVRAAFDDCVRQNHINGSASSGYPSRTCAKVIVLAEDADWLLRTIIVRSSQPHILNAFPCSPCGTLWSHYVQSHRYHDLIRSARRSSAQFKGKFSRQPFGFGISSASTHVVSSAACLYTHCAWPPLGSQHQDPSDDTLRYWY